MPRVALITGITGFVGPYLAKRLLNSGFDVFGLYRLRADGSKPKRLAETGITDQVELIESDVTDLTSLIFALERCKPDFVFHLASQSFVPRSFEDPLETFRVNEYGTQNLLEAIRLKELDCKLIFAGSSEEYGLQIASQRHYEWVTKRYGEIFPAVERIPELPVNENNRLRPMSPYAVSKVSGELLCRNYHDAYGLKTIISRAFNHEGVGRGPQFVTSSIARQCVKIKYKETDKLLIGNVNVFRDWSHVEDIAAGYALLAEKALSGGIYVQGSQRSNSVLTYILFTLEQLGYQVEQIRTVADTKKLKDPTEKSKMRFFNRAFEKTKVDESLLQGEIEYPLEDKGLKVTTHKGEVKIVFDPSRIRNAEVPILMSDTTKISRLGFNPGKKLKDIIKDQVNYYLSPENRRVDN